jgi:hypothetical protein
MKSTILHLRFPFSIFLSPIYLFALSQSQTHDWTKAIEIFIILHLLIYPASNGYNSYFDRDEGPIGGLENPPPVNKQLFYAAWLLDLIAYVWAWLSLGWIFGVGLIIYSFISKAYSHPRIRLKKYPIAGWLVVGLFQGAFVYLMVVQCLEDISLSVLLQPQYLLPAIWSSFNLWGFYPMTQIYQHDEDARRGDLTLSRLLGIKGTFMFTGAIFGLATVGFWYYFRDSVILSLPIFVVYLLVMAPSLIFFNVWFWKVLKDETQANFRHTMMLNLLGSLCLNIFFVILLIAS